MMWREPSRKRTRDRARSHAHLMRRVTWTIRDKSPARSSGEAIRRGDDRRSPNQVVCDSERSAGSVDKLLSLRKVRIIDRRSRDKVWTSRYEHTAPNEGERVRRSLRNSRIAIERADLIADTSGVEYRVLSGCERATLIISSLLRS
jgi:hypothetical protein